MGMRCSAGCNSWVFGFEGTDESLPVTPQADEEHAFVLAPLDWLVLLRQRSMATVFGNRVTL